MRAVIIVTLLAFMITPVQAQDVAPITTYIPTVGDKLVFDYTPPGDIPARAEVTATIASVGTRIGAVEVDVVIVSRPTRNRNRLESNVARRTLVWHPSPNFIENNFVVRNARRDAIRVGKFSIDCVRVDSGTKTFWFSIDAKGTSQYPELIRAVDGDRVLVNLRSITRPTRRNKKAR